MGRSQAWKAPDALPAPSRLGLTVRFMPFLVVDSLIGEGRIDSGARSKV